MVAEKEIHTARIGDKMIVVNGVDNLAYVDLTKVNKGSKRKAVVRYTDSYKKKLFKFLGISNGQ